MKCPLDESQLEYRSDPHSGRVKYHCDDCGGIFQQGDFQDDSKYDLYEPNLNPQYAGESLKCAFDGGLMTEQGKYYICFHCRGRWQPGNKITESYGYSKNKATVMVAEIVGLFIMGITLFSWQLGSFNSSAADPVNAATQVPVKAFVILIWFITFTLVFLLPATIYEQMVMAHRPHFNKASHHPLVRWLPLIIISIMALNIYFFTP